MKLGSVQQAWDELCKRKFSVPIPDAQNEIMQWAFYHGVATLLVRIQKMGDEKISKEEAADDFNRIRDELINFFEAFDEQKH